MLLPVVDELDGVILGGDARALREVLDDAGLAPLARLTKRLPKRTLAVPDPNLRVLRSALPQFVAVPISVNDVARFDSAPAQHDDQAGH